MSCLSLSRGKRYSGSYWWRVSLDIGFMRRHAYVNMCQHNWAATNREHLLLEPITTGTQASLRSKFTWKQHILELSGVLSVEKKIVGQLVIQFSCDLTAGVKGWPCSTYILVLQMSREIWLKIQVTTILTYGEVYLAFFAPIYQPLILHNSSLKLKFIQIEVI